MKFATFLDRGVECCRLPRSLFSLQTRAPGLAPITRRSFLLCIGRSFSPSPSLARPPPSGFPLIFLLFLPRSAGAAQHLIPPTGKGTDGRDRCDFGRAGGSSARRHRWGIGFRPARLSPPYLRERESDLSKAVLPNAILAVLTARMYVCMHGYVTGY